MSPRRLHDHDSGDGLLSVDDAREKVLSQIHALPPIELPLTDAYGCVAAGDVLSAVDLPEFPSSAMDGFAVRADDVTGATPDTPVELKVVGKALIGQRPEATVGMGEAVAIATGAPIPGGRRRRRARREHRLVTGVVWSGCSAWRPKALTSDRAARTSTWATSSCRQASGSALPSWASSRTRASRIRWSTRARA